MPRSEERVPTLKGGPSLPGGDEWSEWLFLWKNPREEARGSSPKELPRGEPLNLTFPMGPEKREGPNPARQLRQ